MRNGADVRNRKLAGVRRAGLAVAALAFAGGVASGARADDLPRPATPLATQIASPDAQGIGAAAARWARQACRARFPASADRCVAVAAPRVVETHVVEGIGQAMTGDVWLEDAALAAASGIGAPSAAARPEFRLKLCRPSPVWEDGARVSNTLVVVDPGEGCTEPPTGADSDAATLSALRLVRSIVLAERVEDDAAVGVAAEAPPEDPLLSLPPEALPPARGRERARGATPATRRDARPPVGGPPDAVASTTEGPATRFVPED